MAKTWHDVFERDAKDRVGGSAKDEKGREEKKTLRELYDPVVFP